MIENRQLRLALAAGLADAPLVRLHMPATVTTRDIGVHGVTLTLADGTRLAAPLLIVTTLLAPLSALAAAATSRALLLSVSPPVNVLAALKNRIRFVDPPPSILSPFEPAITELILVFPPAPASVIVGFAP